MMRELWFEIIMPGAGGCLIVLSLVFGLVVLANSVNVRPGDGEMVGTIVKLSHVGLICRTWEAKIIRGALADGSGAFGTAIDFTVEDERLLPAVRDAMQSKREVRVRFMVEGLYAWCRSDSDGRFATAVGP